MHNKQFIISKRIVEKKDFKHIYMNNEYVLSYHNELNIVSIKDRILLGHAFQSDWHRDMPEKELANIKTPIDTYSTWNGRWALIFKNEIHPDASAQLGIFYGVIQNEQVISSSLSLIAELYEGEFTINKHMPLEYNLLLSWIPGPYTVINGVNRLLPTQYLKVKDNEISVSFRNPISKTDYSNFTVKEIYNRIFDLQKCAFSYIERYDFQQFCYDENRKNTFNIGLTAGYDSRMQVAMLKNMGLHLKSHTFERRKSTECADTRCPKAIADLLNIEWKYILIGHRKASRVIEYNDHTFDSVKDRDWKWHYTCGQYDEVYGDVIVSNSIWESFSNYYTNFGSVARLHDSADNKFEDLKKIFDTLEGNPVSEKSLKKYIEWVDEHPIEGLSWADRITFEQLMGIWDGNENQGKDLFSHNKFLFNPANSMEIFALILALPMEKRINRLWEKEVVDTFAPELKKIPYNMWPANIRKEYYFPYDEEIYGRRIVLYGAGCVGKSFYMQIMTQNKCNIVAWIDKNYNEINKTGIHVCAPNTIEDVDYDYLIIAVESIELYKSVSDELVEKGVQSDRILWKETWKV